MCGRVGACVRAYVCVCVFARAFRCGRGPVAVLGEGRQHHLRRARQGEGKEGMRVCGREFQHAAGHRRSWEVTGGHGRSREVTRGHERSREVTGGHKESVDGAECRHPRQRALSVSLYLSHIISLLLLLLSLSLSLSPPPSPREVCKSAAVRSNSTRA